MKEVQLFMLMDANARTARSGGGKLGSDECKVLGAYGRDTINDKMVSDSFHFLPITGLHC